jgi:hypothetical protein
VQEIRYRTIPHGWAGRSNKGESRNSLARAVFLHRLGEIRDQTYKNQQHRAIAALRTVEDVPDHLLAHLSPLGWEHVNLTGDYIWNSAANATVNHGGLKPLRPIPEATPLTA